jgi:hypothetical protein
MIFVFKVRINLLLRGLKTSEYQRYATPRIVTFQSATVTATITLLQMET